MSEPTLQHFLSRLIRRENLTRADATDLLNALLADNSTDAQIAGVLIALSAKGETVDELTGLARGLRDRATRIKSSHSCFIDTAGTGSSRSKTFNISTAAAFVIAGAGLPVAKHGNRAASSKSGSADVLTELGVNVSVPPDVSEASLNEIGICFMFAPLYHSATARVAAVRKQLAVQTTFNLLGPMSNPAGAPRQIVGVWRDDLVEKVASVLAALGTERAWVVNGHDGLDEITLAGPTHIAEATEGEVKSFSITPEDFGLQAGRIEHLRGGDSAANAKTIKEVLSGTRRDEARTLVVMTAAAALVVGGSVAGLQEGVVRAGDSIDTGAALNKLEELVRVTNSV
jgi:anthranilate phosphoribosyltransferase